MGFFFPLLDSTFDPYYGSIAKHIVLTHNWTDLVLSNHDWLDKPHLPFWLTAISFHIFGINAAAYILPGFVFYLFGVIYVYRLAILLFQQQEIGILAALFTVSALHLMLSSIDVRAEAYLIGSIIPACYYWLKFDRHPRLKYLLLGALFTALALMTKGLFVLITISSGLIGLWIYRRYNPLRLKWLVALVLTFILITPELLALYNQFDLHPEKIVFGQQHISGIKWYFWGSQFGRFFNTGSIMSTNPVPYHELFFIHTFLWAYLPWSIIFVIALYYSIRHVNWGYIYLWYSFFITFILFSITTFQVDHYINIILPFASIICAKWYYELIAQSPMRPWKIYYIQNIVIVFLIIISFILNMLIFTHGRFWLINIILLFSIIIIVLLYRLIWHLKLLIYSVMAINIIFLSVVLVNGWDYIKYDAGYQSAIYLNKYSHIHTAGYNIDSLALYFYSNNSYVLVTTPSMLNQLPQDVYLVMPLEQVQFLPANFLHGPVIHQFPDMNIQDYIHHLGEHDQNKNLSKSYVIIHRESAIKNCCGLRGP